MPKFLLKNCTFKFGIKYQFSWLKKYILYILGVGLNYWGLRRTKKALNRALRSKRYKTNFRNKYSHNTTEFSSIIEHEKLVYFLL